jgi:ATP-dependent RNA helicase SUPV3L1/SUV3
MVEEGQGSAENDLPAAETQPRHDFSVVQGFQVVGGDDHGAAGDPAWRDALRLELETRAARLHQAVDAAIVLSNDGIIRWLGDPVAKLSLGENVLNPTVLILADESVPDASRETIKTRIELWIAATTRRVLAPLFALESVQEGSEIVRDLAHELARALGILEREPIKSKIKALAQDDRAELRKQGVRFGAHYIFVPALLKPAPRALALQLWGLQAPGDVRELLRALGPVASSGRTSLPLEKEISKDGYRVAGYRTCGERVVRVDVLERLAGMIRAALAGEAPEGAKERQSHRSPKGFIVSGEMTSLTGCSGEAFASILRSIGFRSVEMKRSDFLASQLAGEAAKPNETLKPKEEQGPIADDQAPVAAAREEEARAAEVSGAPTEPSRDLALEGADTTIEDGEAIPEEADSVLPGVDPVIEEPEGSAESAEVFATDADAVAEHTEASAESGGAIAEDDSAADSVATAIPDGAASSDGALEADVVGAHSVSHQTSGPKGDPAKNADLIVVWRPDRPRPDRSRPARHRAPSESRPPTSGPRSPADADRQPPERKWARRAATRLPSRPNGPEPPNADEKRRQRASDYDKPRVNPTPAPQRPVKVDPNSPFAKLLELRSLLEEKANKRH